MGSSYSTTWWAGLVIGKRQQSIYRGFIEKFLLCCDRSEALMIRFCLVFLSCWPVKSNAHTYSTLQQLCRLYVFDFILQGTSTFAEYVVVPEISCALIDEAAPLEKARYFASFDNDSPYVLLCTIFNVVYWPPWRHITNHCLEGPFKRFILYPF